MKARARRAALTLVMCGVAAGGAPAYGQPGAASRYLVIPFENVQGEPRLYWLSEGSAVLLTDDLLALGAAPITREDRLRAFDSLNVPPVATLSHATVIRLGQLVGATDVIVGAFEHREGVLRIRARVIRLGAGRMMPELTVAGPLGDLLTLHADLARRLTGKTDVPVPTIEQGQPPIAAFELYIKGVLAEAPATKLGFLQDALEIHPSFERARLAQWDVYTEQGEHARALDIARAVPVQHAQGRRARFLAATSLINLAQYDEALAELTALQHQKPDPAILNNMGIVLLRRRADQAVAIRSFHDATKLDPDDPDLFFNLGYAYFMYGDARNAAHWLREVVRRNPADDEAHYALGVALQAAGSQAEGLREKELARQLSSQWAEREAKDAAMPPDLERLKAAIVEPGTLRVESVIVAAEQREQQELAAFHLARGRRMLDQERHGEAIAELRRAIYLTPYQAEAHLLLARAYHRTGRPREAIDALKIAVWIDPANDEARALLDELTR